MSMMDYHDAEVAMDENGVGRDYAEEEEEEHQQQQEDEDEGEEEHQIDSPRIHKERENNNKDDEEDEEEDNLDTGDRYDTHYMTAEDYPHHHATSQDDDDDDEEDEEGKGHSERDSEMAVLSSQSGESTRLTAPRSAGGESDNNNNNNNNNKMSSDGGTSLTAAAVAAAKQRAMVQYESSSTPKRPNLWDRLYNEREMHSERMEKLRRQTEEMRRLEELAQEGHRSVAVERHANAVFSHDFFEHQEQWLDDIEVRRQKLKLAADLEELRTLRDPAINAKSRRIVNELGYCGPIEAWDVHFARFCVRHERSLPSHMFRPNINLHPKDSRVNANGDSQTPVDVGARLYDESISRRAKLRQTEKKQREMELKDRVTGQPFFQPMSYTKESDVVSQRKIRSAQEASDTLYQRALEQREKRKRQLEKAQEKHSFKPTLSAATRNMDIKRRPVHEVVKRAPRHDLNNDSKPSIKSTGKSQEEFMSRMEAMQSRRQKKVEVMQDMQRKMEEKNCTFHPRVSKTSEEIFEGSQQRMMSYPQIAMKRNELLFVEQQQPGSGSQAQHHEDNYNYDNENGGGRHPYHEGFIPPPAASFSNMMMGQGQSVGGGGMRAANTYNYSNNSVHSHDPYNTNNNSNYNYQNNNNNNNSNNMMRASDVVHSPVPRIPVAESRDSNAYYYEQQHQHPHQHQHVDPTAAGVGEEGAPNNESIPMENRLSVPISDDVEDAEDMIENFESKMKEVLSEWKKLETL